MKILIVGVGKLGYSLAGHLSREGHDLVIVDSDPRALEECSRHLDVLGVRGNGASMRVLKEAGVESADLLIAVTGSDESNLLACVMARRLSGVKTIARVRDPEYSEVGQLALLREELGLSMTVNPELAAARELVRLLQFPSFMGRDTFVSSRVEIVEIGIGRRSPLDGIPLHRLETVVKTKVLICAVSREERVIIPNGGFILREGDRIYVTADTHDLATLIRELGIQTRPVKTVMVVGGNRTAYYLARLLLRFGMRVKLIERDRVRAEKLAELLPSATVIEADGTLPSVLDEEGIARSDALVAMTNIDEENMIVAIHGKRAGVQTVIPKVNRMEYLEICKGMGVHSTISPIELCASNILRYVRALDNTSGGSVLTLHRIAGGEVETLEFRAEADAGLLGKPLCELKLKKNLLICYIQHEGVGIFPKGNDCIREGDRVIVAATADQAIKNLNDILA